MKHIFTLILPLFLLLAGCEKKAASTPAKPTVLVSVAPYLYFVKKIAGDAVNVIPLTPPGANPHVYEPSPKEVQAHQKAELWVYLGEASDKKIYNYFRDHNIPIEIAKVTDGVSLLTYGEEEHHHCCHHSHEDDKDLHVWLSPKLAKIQAKTIAEGLFHILPEENERLAKNLHLFLEELDALDQTIATQLDSKKGTAILVSHPAFGYFCEDYGLEQISVEVEGKDPLPQHVTHILKQAQALNIRTILLEPQYSNKGAELIAKNLDLPTHMVDPYAENYFENLLHLAHIIAEE